MASPAGSAAVAADAPNANYAVSAREEFTPTAIWDDGSRVNARDDLESLKEQAGTVTPVVVCPTDEFVRRLGERSLPGGIYYDVGPLPDIAAANRLMDDVRRYRV